MRAFLVSLCLLVVSGAFAQDLKETHGKTNAQILAMGYDKWYSFYTGLEGESTLGMSSANILYAGSMAWRNDKLIAKYPAGKQKTFKTLRTLMDNFGDNMVQIGRGLAGGGTMWTIVGSSQQVSVEETLYGVLGGKVKAAPAMVVSQARKELDTLGAEVKDSKGWGTEFPKEDTLKLYREARESFDKIVGLLKGLDRKSSDLVLSYCRDTVKSIREES